MSMYSVKAVLPSVKFFYLSLKTNVIVECFHLLKTIHLYCSEYYCTALLAVKNVYLLCFSVNVAVFI